jgi:conjugal transfer/entry exclusion protein
MRVVLQLREDVALDLQNQYSHARGALKARPETQQLLKAAAKLGVRLTPVHPGQTHPLLATHFQVEAKDKKTAEEIIRRFQQFDSVEAAYVEPEHQTP